MLLPSMINLLVIEDSRKQRWGDITRSRRRGQVGVDLSFGCITAKPSIEELLNRRSSHSPVNRNPGLIQIWGKPQRHRKRQAPVKAWPLTFQAAPRPAATSRGV